MSTRCRTCGKNIYCLNAKNLFQQKDNIVLHQIQALTGLFLLEQTDFPAYICGPCVVALREAIEFRERVIRTQKLLLSSDSVENAFEAIDFEEVGKLHLDDGDQTELSNSHEEITVYGYPNYENECDTDIENHINEIKSETESMEEDISAVPVQNQDKDLSITAALSDETTMLPNMQHKTEKPTSKLYATVNFASNGKHTPRINWSKLSEDEIVMLKRERRKRDCICELCGRHFACPSNFKVHLLRHTGVKNFPCAQCPLKFYTPHLLRRHELAHLCQKPYPCQFCGQTFADYSGRIQHERNRHTNYKPYKCTKCEKAFAVSTKLKRHMLSHSGVRSFHCEVCKASFMRRSHLSAHFRSKGHEQNAQNSVASVADTLETDVKSELFIECP